MKSHEINSKPSPPSVLGPDLFADLMPFNGAPPLTGLAGLGEQPRGL